MAEESSDDGTMAPLEKSPKIVIIGAGISGLAAASDLGKAGFSDVTILEASNRVGGRIWSIDLETVPGAKAELGANWIHGIDQNPIFKIAREHGLLDTHYQGRKLGKKIMFVQECGSPVNTKVVEEVDFAYGMLINQCEEFYQEQIPTPVDSVGEFLEREFAERMCRYSARDLQLRQRILRQRMLGECIVGGCHSLGEMSLSELGAFKELPGVHHVIPPGFEAVLNILRGDVPDARIQLNQEVTQISWRREMHEDDNHDDNHATSPATSPANATNVSSVCVECANGKRYNADHVIVTSSLGVLKKYQTRLFSPPLPNFKTDAMNRLTIGTVNKVILEFDGQVLPDEVFRLELIWDIHGEEIVDLKDSWVKKIGAFEAVAHNVLIGWLSGREAEYMETLPEEEVGQTCIQVLQKFLSGQPNPLPNLKRITRSMWKTNPFTLGSYTFIPVGGQAEDIEALAEPINDQQDRPVLQFAGEATHPYFYSSSHGALLSGQREAERLIELYTH